MILNYIEDFTKNVIFDFAKSISSTSHIDETADFYKCITQDGKAEINFLLNRFTEAGDYRILYSYFVVDGAYYGISKVHKEGESISFSFKYFDNDKYRKLLDIIGGADYIPEIEFERNEIFPTISENEMKYFVNQLGDEKNIIDSAQTFVYDKLGIVKTSTERL